MNGIALSPLTMIRLPFLLGFFLLLTGSAPFADAASSGQEQGDGGVVHIGIQETLDPEFFVDTLGPTMRHLRKRFPHLRFHAETFSIAELSQAIQTKSISFFIADSGLFTFLASTEHADDLATRQNRFSSDPAKSTGAVLFVRADRNDLQTLSDLRGRKIAAQNPNDFTSWLTFQGELVRAGFDPKKFWGAELFTEYEYPNVLDSVSAGETDAGLLAACALEEQTALHGYRLEDFRVLHEQTSNALRCRRSTALYPGPVFASLPHADPALTKQITLALLTEPPSENGSAWGISTDNSEALNLYKLLKTGPYSYLNDTNWSALWANYQEWIFAAFGLLMLLIIHTLRVDRLVERRTAELQASIAERDALEKANQANAQMLAQMERAGIVAQLSSMVAHELRQPLMSIMNFVGGLSLYMRKTYPADPVVAQTADVIVEEAERASAIVDRVRGYDPASRQKITQSPETK
ncbi:PhnD/SsuA/transferrin family substrate-binding protein [Sutterella wadsworthensis]|uniref:PhnD/SsuA/transferrin family substrate-binding protein n=1 Tax=Sutterella wadsworthensis TaxID=40545 RepID=UPI0035642CA9